MEKENLIKRLVENFEGNKILFKCLKVNEDNNKKGK
jgi:hypothetical protein